MGDPHVDGFKDSQHLKSLQGSQKGSQYVEQGPFLAGVRASDGPSITEQLQETCRCGPQVKVQTSPQILTVRKVATPQPQAQGIMFPINSPLYI